MVIDDAPVGPDITYSIFLPKSRLPMSSPAGDSFNQFDIPTC